MGARFSEFYQGRAHQKIRWVHGDEGFSFFLLIPLSTLVSKVAPSPVFLTFPGMSVYNCSYLYSRYTRTKNKAEYIPKGLLAGLADLIDLPSS